MEGNTRVLLSAPPTAQHTAQKGGGTARIGGALWTPRQSVLRLLMFPEEVWPEAMPNSSGLQQLAKANQTGSL